MNRHPHAGGFAAYSEMLPQSAAVAFVLAEVAVNGAVMECYPVVFMQVGAYLFGTEFAADGAFVAVKLFGDFGDGAVAGQLLDVVSFVLGQLCVAHGNLSCRKGRMLPHTGLSLLWKVALQMRIRRPLFSLILHQTGFPVFRRRLPFTNPSPISLPSTPVDGAFRSTPCPR